MTGAERGVTGSITGADAHPINDIIAFHNEVAQYERYDWDHLLHPDQGYADADDIVALLKDFKALDDIYCKYADALDLSLRLFPAQLVRAIVALRSRSAATSPRHKAW